MDEDQDTMPTPFLPGYILYIGVIFLPGLGLGEVFDLWKRYQTLGERFALCLGLGLVADTIVFSLRDYGPLLLGLRAAGVDIETNYFLLAIGLLFLSVGVTKRKKFLFVTKPKLTDYLLLSIIVIILILLELYLNQFPIFPQNLSGDYSRHILAAVSLASGSPSSGVAILYEGVRLQLASDLILVGGEALITVRNTMVILVALSPLLFYLGAKEIFESHEIAVITSALFSLNASIWFVTAFDSGLYANLFGIMITLFLLVTTKKVIDEPRNGLSWVIFLSTLFAGYFSHYTMVTIIPALLLLPLIQLKRERRTVTNYLWPAIALVAPILIVVSIRPQFLNRLLTLAFNGGGSISFTTVLARFLSPIPVLGYMASEVSDDLAFVVLLLFAIIGTLGVLKSKSTYALLPLLWLVSLLVVAPLSISAWRFSLEALVPITLLAGYGVSMIFAEAKHRIGETRTLRADLKVVAVFLVLFAPMFYGSWGGNIVVSSFTTNSTAQTQRQVYSAINWLGNNTCSNSSYLSVTDWRFTYTNLIIGRPTYYKYFSEEDQALAFAKSVNATYLVVTKDVTLQIPSFAQLFPWNTFQQNSNLTLVFTNSDVRIYKIN